MLNTFSTVLVMDSTYKTNLYRMPLFEIVGTEKRFKYFLDGLHPPTNSSGIVLEDKWLTLPNMGHIVTTCYNRVVVQLVLPERGICETYFPIRGAPPLNPHSNILCLRLIPDHFCFSQQWGIIFWITLPWPIKVTFPFTITKA